MFAKALPMIQNYWSLKDYSFARPSELKDKLWKINLITKADWEVEDLI
jgi:hypothetical protein